MQVTRGKKEDVHRGWVVACDRGGREKPFVEDMELTRSLDEPALGQGPCRGPTDYSWTGSTTSSRTAWGATHR